MRPSVPRRTDGRTELAREALENAETRVQRQTVSEVKSALKTYDDETEIVRDECALLRQLKKKEWVGPRHKRPTYLWFRPLLAPHSKLLPFRPSPSLSGAFSFYTTSASAPVVMVFFYSSSSSPVPRHHVFFEDDAKEKKLCRIVSHRCFSITRSIKDQTWCVGVFESEFRAWLSLIPFSSIFVDRCCPTW